MSVNSVDPAKKTHVPFINVDPPKPEAKKPTVNLDAQPNAPKPDFAALFAAQTAPPKFDGPGVSSSVFGKVSPKVTSMSDKQLVDNIAKLSAAMRANPGKVNDQDFTIFRAMVDAASNRANSQLGSSTPPTDMSHRELYTALIAFDVARASGAKLTKEQEARYAALDKERSARSSNDPSGDIKRLEGERIHYAEKMAVHCGAAAAGAASLATHRPAIGVAGAILVIGHAAMDGHAGASAFESALLAASAIKKAHVGAEGVAIVANMFQCLEAREKYKEVDSSYKSLTGAK